jgi:hypothetical protein
VEHRDIKVSGVLSGFVVTITAPWGDLRTCLQNGPRKMRVCVKPTWTTNSQEYKKWQVGPQHSHFASPGTLQHTLGCGAHLQAPNILLSCTGEGRPSRFHHLHGAERAGRQHRLDMECRSVQGHGQICLNSLSQEITEAVVQAGTARLALGHLSHAQLTTA